MDNNIIYVNIVKKLFKYEELRTKAERSDIDKDERERVLSRLGHVHLSLKKAIDHLPKARKD